MERREHKGDGSPAERIEEAGREGAAAAREEARSYIERGKASAADAADDTAQALDDAASSLRERGRDSLAEAAGTFANQLSSLASSLENRSVDDLLRQARRVARENPAMFTAGGIALGVALSRFFRASASSAQAERRPPARIEKETPARASGATATRYGAHGSAYESSPGDDSGRRQL